MQKRGKKYVGRKRKFHYQRPLTQPVDEHGYATQQPPAKDQDIDMDYEMSRDSECIEVDQDCDIINEDLKDSEIDHFTYLKSIASVTLPHGFVNTSDCKYSIC